MVLMYGKAVRVILNPGEQETFISQPVGQILWRTRLDTKLARWVWESVLTLVSYTPGVVSLSQWMEKSIQEAPRRPCDSRVRCKIFCWWSGSSDTWQCSMIDPSILKGRKQLPLLKTHHQRSGKRPCSQSGRSMLQKESALRWTDEQGKIEDTEAVDIHGSKY